VEYYIVRAINMEQMIRRVNQKLLDGWKLQGGVSATGGFHVTTEMFQSMIKPID